MKALTAVVVSTAVSGFASYLVLERVQQDGNRRALLPQLRFVANEFSSALLYSLLIVISWAGVLCSSISTMGARGFFA